MHRRHLLLAAMFVVVGWALPGCDDTSSSYCQRDSDCPLAGYRCSDGLCTPKILRDGSPDGLSDSQPADVSIDAGSDALPDVDHDGGSTCSGNSDDRVARSEMPIAVGSKVAYSIGTGLTVDLKGTQQSGRTHWDLTANASDDQRIVSELLPVFAWAQKDFTDATYAALIDQGQGAYGVFKATDNSLQLLGVISEKQAVPFLSGITLSYAKPIDMLRFPVGPTGKYTTESSASGYFNGPWLYVSESYDVEVLGAGTLKLPDITFDVVLQRSVLTQKPYANPLLVQKRTVFLFLAECYGIVARIVVDGEAPDLSAVPAKERWRLAF